MAVHPSSASAEDPVGLGSCLGFPALTAVGGPCRHGYSMDSANGPTILDELT